jgi:hypothetical protein
MNLNKQLNEHEKIKVIKTLKSLAFAIEITGMIVLHVF